MLGNFLRWAFVVAWIAAGWVLVAYPIRLILWG